MERQTILKGLHGWTSRQDLIHSCTKYILSLKSVLKHFQALTTVNTKMFFAVVLLAQNAARSSYTSLVRHCGRPEGMNVHIPGRKTQQHNLQLCMKLLSIHSGQHLELAVSVQKKWLQSSAYCYIYTYCKICVLLAKSFNVLRTNCM